MIEDWFALVEMALVFGIAMAFGFSQLWSLRKYDRAPKRPDQDGSAGPKS